MSGSTNANLPLIRLRNTFDFINSIQNVSKQDKVTSVCMANTVYENNNIDIVDKASELFVDGDWMLLYLDAVVQKDAELGI